MERCFFALYSTSVFWRTMASLGVFVAFGLLLCAVSESLALPAQVIRIGHRFKLVDVTDGNLRQALGSIESPSATVHELDLSGNTLSTISAEDLTAFENLRVVDLSVNLIAGAVDLRSLGKLQHVDLSNNLISEVSVGPSVESLQAANNGIEKLHCSARAPKTISLSNNRITSLANLSPTCRNGIEHLDLSLNEITQLDFGEVANSRETLRTLTVEYNSIVNVLNSAGVVFSSLDLLNVSSNRLAYLGEAFGAAAKVSTFDASHNRIAFIAPNLLFERAVTSFDLRGNDFSCSTLRKFFRTNEFLYQISVQTLEQAIGLERENCAEKVDRVGPYCCEPLASVSAVDKLIEVKRGKLLSWDRTDGQQDCERESLAVRRKMEYVRERYRTSNDERRLMEREQLLLSKEKEELEHTLEAARAATEELEELLLGAAEELGVSPATNDTLQMVKDIVSACHEQHEAASKRKQDAAGLLEKYESYIRLLAREKVRLQQEMAQFSEAYRVWV